MTFGQESHGLDHHDVACGLPELDVVENAVGEVLSAHVGVCSADEEAPRGVEV